MSETKNFIENIIDKDLAEGVYDTVHTRFPPEPNGYLHIGHAKSVLLNYGLAKEYNGKFNMRFDDTNPTKERTEFVESIKEDIKWLGADWEDRLFFASDYFDQMYEAAVKLIKKGKAYVSDLSPEQIKEYRGTLTQPGREDPGSARTVEENLALFEDMRAGKFKDGEKVLRARIDMTSPNINMRDPVIYRVAHMTHHNTGDKWCIYPMYDFAHPIEDAIEGITHSICTLEFEDHRPLYDWVVRELECKAVSHQCGHRKAVYQKAGGGGHCGRLGRSQTGFHCRSAQKRLYAGIHQTLCRTLRRLQEQFLCGLCHAGVLYQRGFEGKEAPHDGGVKSCKADY